MSESNDQKAQAEGQWVVTQKATLSTHKNLVQIQPPVFYNGEESVIKEWVRVNKSENSGWTSVDRSTKATLSTYNTWIHVSRLQKIYHFQSLKLWLTAKPLTAEAADMQQGRDLMLDM